MQTFKLISWNKYSYEYDKYREFGGALQKLILKLCEAELLIEGRKTFNSSLSFLFYYIQPAGCELGRFAKRSGVKLRKTSEGCFRGYSSVG